MKLEKTFSKMTDDEKRLMIERVSLSHGDRFRLNDEILGLRVEREITREIEEITRRS